MPKPAVPSDAFSANKPREGLQRGPLMDLSFQWVPPDHYLDRGGVGIAPHGYGDRELLQEDGEGPQLPWEHKIKEGPQLLQVVLQR